MANWRPIRTAPKDGEILVCVTNNLGDLVALSAMWGQPEGYDHPGWWAATFSLVSGDALRDMPELHARLMPITPVCWKPWPEGKR